MRYLPERDIQLECRFWHFLANYSCTALLSSVVCPADYSTTQNFVERTMSEEEKNNTEMAKLHRKFELFDANGDGVLTKKEINDMLTRGGKGGKLNMQMANDFLYYAHNTHIKRAARVSAHAQSWAHCSFHYR